MKELAKSAAVSLLTTKTMTSIPSRSKYVSQTYLEPLGNKLGSRAMPSSAALHGSGKDVGAARLAVDGMENATVLVPVLTGPKYLHTAYVDRKVMMYSNSFMAQVYTSFTYMSEPLWCTR